MPRPDAFGHWPSPLHAAQVAGSRVWPTDLLSDGQALYWLEARPAEAGRVVLVRWLDGTATDHSPAGVSIRSRVHEYGGAAACLVPGADGAFAYVDQADQRVWLCGGAGEPPRAVSAEAPSGQVWHHGGLTASPDGTAIVAVREVHHRSDDTATGPERVERFVVALRAADADADADADATILMQGHDFFGAPVLNADGTRLAVVAWDHPDMPWDASKLLVQPLGRGPVADGAPLIVAGGADESIGQPHWTGDGSLLFVSDHAGWWQPYLASGQDSASPVRRLTAAEAEFHGPDWNLGQHTMAYLSTPTDGALVARMTRDGRDSLVTLAPRGTPETIEQPCINISSVCAFGDGVAFIGATADGPASVWHVRLGPDPSLRQLRATASSVLSSAQISGAEAFGLTGRSGRPIHGLLFAPRLDGTEGPADRRPPLIVWCHSGPTTATQPNFDPMVQFFTTRGFAVAAVDYAGSTGYGRAYRNSLRGLWGVADSEDCLDAALYLAATDLIDGTRMAVRGTSAGGMTALNALASGEGFAACFTMFAVTDLMVLPEVSHDFEAHYSDSLIGPLPESAPLYEARSPVNRAAEMHGAVLLLHGSDDPVVPLSQAEAMHRALTEAGRQSELRVMAGEGHGFRRAETVEAALEAELGFYRTHLRL